MASATYRHDDGWHPRTKACGLPKYWPSHATTMLVLCVQAAFFFGTVAHGARLNQELEVPTSPPSTSEFARRIRKFTALDYRVGDRDYAYRLFIPDRARSKKPQPLLLWLHGYGESGNDNWRHLVYIKDEIAAWEKRSDGFPCFVLAPQSPSDNHWNEDVLSYVLRLLRHTIAVRSIDENRIYLAGVSSGGNACWTLAAWEPELFAAMAPMASGGIQGQVDTLRDLPVWAFHVAKDPGLPVDGVRASIAALEDVGGHCWLTETAGKNHDCWTTAFRDYDVIAWLLRQRRGSSVVPVSRAVQWTSFRDRYMSYGFVIFRRTVPILLGAFGIYLIAVYLTSYGKPASKSRRYKAKLNTSK